MEDFIVGVLVSMMIVFVVTGLGLVSPASQIHSVRAEGYEALEYIGARILMDDAIDIGEAVHFATTDGYFIYYDGVLYQEIK